MVEKLYSLDDHPEHGEELKTYAQEWIANAMSTETMSKKEKEICRDAVRKLYEAADLEAPPPERIVFVPSPFAMVFAAGFAAEIWARRDHVAEQAVRKATYDATRQATDDATRKATEQATHHATDDATWKATYKATDEATRQATWKATDEATRQATYDATYKATEDATWKATDEATNKDKGESWYIVTDDMLAVAQRLGIGKEGIRRAEEMRSCWQGGNQWSASSSFVCFFRYIAQLDIDYSAWDAWEILSRHSGPRIIHPKFCIVSDRPDVLLVDDNNLPHCETGPFCRWRDGSALYAWHGTYVPARWIECREELTAAEVVAVEDVEQRAAGAQIVGWPKMLSELEAEVLDDSGDLRIGKLLSVTLPGLIRPGRFLQAECPRNGTIIEGVAETDDFGLPIKTAVHAQAWRVGLHPAEYRQPEVRT